MSLILTTAEAAQVAGVTPQAIRMWVLAGDLEPLRRGAKPLRFRYDDVARVQRGKRSGAWERRHAEAAERWSTCLAGERL